RSRVAVEVTRAGDAQAGLDVRLDHGERPGRDVSGANARRERVPLRVVLGGKRLELAVDDAERVHRHERAGAQPGVGQGGEYVTAEDLADRLRNLLPGRPLAHRPTCSRRWQISYSTSAPSRPRIASSTL